MRNLGFNTKHSNVSTRVGYNLAVTKNSTFPRVFLLGGRAQNQQLSPRRRRHVIPAPELQQTRAARVPRVLNECTFGGSLLPTPGYDLCVTSIAGVVHQLSTVLSCVSSKLVVHKMWELGRLWQRVGHGIISLSVSKAYFMRRHDTISPVRTLNRW